MVVAATENDVIGRDNGMRWHLPDDLKYPSGDNTSDVARYLQIRLPAGAKKVITDPDNLPQLLSRIDAAYFKDIVRAIRTAAKELEHFNA